MLQQESEIEPITPEGSFLILDEPYLNPPWKNLLIDFTQPIIKKSPLKFTAIEAMEVFADEDGNLSGYNSTLDTKSFSASDSLIDFYIHLATTFSKRLVAVYYPHELDLIIKGLGLENVTELLIEGRITWAGIQFYYTPNRNLTIRYEKFSVKIQPVYDWFVPHTLDELIEDTIAENIINPNTPNYRLQALKLLTHALFQEIKTAIKNNGEHSPSSIASATAITDIYIDRPARLIDTSKIPEEIHQLAYNSFHAPWIEMTKVGQFKNLIEYDLNSAYPIEVGNLYNISPQAGDWIFVDNSTGNNELPEGVQYGFFYAFIHIKTNVKISPIKIRKGRKLFTATGSWIGTITLDEIKFIEEYDLGYTQILSGWCFVPKLSLKPFKKEINRYLALRQKAKREKRAFLELVIKSSTVRFVGKFLQKTYEPLGGELATVSPTFNPIYATIVMTRVKLKVARLAMLNPDAIANIIVDGLASTESLNIPKDLVNEVKSKTIEHATLVNPQLIYFTREDRHILQDIVKEDPTKTWYQLPKTQYMRLAESIVSNRFDHAGTMRSEGITFEVGSDRKRHWPKSPLFGIDLLRNSYDSVPFNALELELKYPSYPNDEMRELARSMGLKI